jgi:hypothetical protein
MVGIPSAGTSPPQFSIEKLASSVPHGVPVMGGDSSPASFHGLEGICAGISIAHPARQ